MPTHIQFKINIQYYTDWNTDDYLYSYINNNIEKFFNN